MLANLCRLVHKLGTGKRPKVYLRSSPKRKANGIFQVVRRVLQTTQRSQAATRVLVYRLEDTARRQRKATLLGGWRHCRTTLTDIAEEHTLPVVSFVHACPPRASSHVPFVTARNLPPIGPAPVREGARGFSSTSTTSKINELLPGLVWSSLAGPKRRRPPSWRASAAASRPKPTSRRWPPRGRTAPASSEAGTLGPSDGARCRCGRGGALPNKKMREERKMEKYF